MENYLNFNDLKSLIIGIVGGFLVVGLQRYYSNMTIKSTARFLKQTEAQRAQLDIFARSDRALLIRCFQAVYGIFGIISFTICLHIMLTEGRMTFGLLTLVLLWFVPGIVCIGLIHFLQQVAEYPASAEKIDARITALKDKLLRKRP